MTDRQKVKVVREVLGSSTVFSTAVDEVMEAELRRITRDPVTLSQVKLLSLLARGEAYKVSDVALFMGVSNAAASRAVDRLVQRGYVDREESPTDRRAVELSVTQKARRLLAKFRAATDQILEEALGRFPPEELEQVAEVLDRLAVTLLDPEAGNEQVCFRCSIYFREKCLMRRFVGRRCLYSSAAVEPLPGMVESD